jgi:Secretion system C-terminal sorting domain/Reeler domain
MKIKFIYTFFSLCFFAFLFSASSGGRANLGWGNTGAPGDEMSGGNPRTCQSCHGTGTANTIQVTQTFEVTDSDGNDVFTDGYTPGETYNVKLTVNAVTGTPAKYGFQILCLNAALNVNGPEVSDWTAVSNNVAIRTANTTGRKYAEHVNASTSNVFTMTWVAPAQGSGEVTFYVVSNGVNGNNQDNGDGATGGKFTLTEFVPVSATNNLLQQVDISLFPNPVADQLSIKINTALSGNYDWAIMDVQGRTLQNGRFDLVQGENVQQLPVAEMAAGLYQFQLRKDGKTLSQTMVKK